LDRILLETDAPDALPRLDNVAVSPVPVHSSDADTEKRHIDSESQAANASNESLNHPENIHIVSFFSWMLLSKISFQKLFPDLFHFMCSCTFSIIK
jgi:hypothetical protein